MATSQPQPSTPVQSGPQQTSTLILLDLCAQPNANLKASLPGAVHHHPITNIHLLSHSETQLKDLKMDSYALAGKSSRNITVSTHPLPQEHNHIQLSSLLSSLVKEALSPVRGILLSLPESHTGSSNLLTLAPASLDGILDSTIRTLHSIASVTIPALPTAKPGDLLPFFALCNARTPKQDGSTLVHSLIDLTLSELRLSAPGIDLGYAEDIIHAVPVDEKLATPGKVNGAGLRLEMPAGYGSDGASSAGLGEESPTRLWAEWALQEEME